MSGLLLSKKPQAIIFDWDNTLVSNWPAVHRAYNKTMEKYGHQDKKITLKDEHIMGHSLKEQFPKIFKEKSTEAADFFRQTFAENHLEYLTPFDFAETILNKIKDKNIPSFIVSNKTGKFLRAECSHLGWTSYFQNVVGAGDATFDKPHHAPVHLALSKSNISPNKNILFIGDMDVDVLCAQNSGLTSVLITSKKVPAEIKPDYRFLNLEELNIQF